ncbi:ATP synthase F1 subunit epsilon [candidate division GN15 bacterium]|nr:ATP synthase F1 subunit epsilon [candidate division GN15 bacterium]
MFRLSIVTPERVYYDGDVASLVVPGTEGYLGILSNHAPLITALQEGRIEYRDEADTVHILAVSGGFLEVFDNKATLLADAVEAAEEIDVDRARDALERARKKLEKVSSGSSPEEINVDEARDALQRARNRIKVYNETH